MYAFEYCKWVFLFIFAFCFFFFADTVTFDTLKSMHIVFDIIFSCYFLGWWCFSFSAFVHSRLCYWFSFSLFFFFLFLSISIRGFLFFVFFGKMKWSLTACLLSLIVFSFFFPIVLGFIFCSCMSYYTMDVCVHVVQPFFSIRFPSLCLFISYACCRFTWMYKRRNESNKKICKKNSRSNQLMEKSKKEKMGNMKIKILS